MVESRYSRYAHLAMICPVGFARKAGIDFCKGELLLIPLDMAKTSKKDLDLTRLVMGRLAAMPHKPHVAKKAAKKAKKKARKTKVSPR